MIYSGMIPNILNISILEKKGEDIAYKTWYFDHK
jgi:hypothetical protein